MAIAFRWVVACLLFGGAVARAEAQNQWMNWESPHVAPLALTPDGTRLLAVNSADQRLEVFAISAGNALPQWLRSIPVGLDPVSVRARDNGEAWVVNHLSDSISIVDLASGRVTRILATGDEPTDVVFAGSPRRAFVSLSQLNQLRIYDPANPAAAPIVLPLEGEEPRALAVSPDGSRVYAAFFESGNLSTIVEQQDVSDPSGPYGGLNPPPNSGNTFVPPLAAGLPNGPPVAQIVRRDANGAWRDDNDRNWSAFVTWNLHDHDVAIIDANALTVGYANSLMTTVMALGVKPDGTVAAVGTEALNQVRFEPNVQSVFIRVLIGSFDPNAPTATQIADLNPHLDYSVRSVPTEVRAQALGDPRAIAWHPSDGSAFVAGMGSNNLVITDASGIRLGRIAVGQGPTGLAFNADATRLYVLNKFDATISTVDTAARSELGRVGFYDPTPLAVKQGRPLLYDTHATSGLGQLSCASCHIDGRSDFLAWDLGNPQGEMKDVNQPCRQGQVCRPWHPLKGPMMTQSLQGIIGNEPLHWRGDKENLAAFAPAFVGLQGMDAEPDANQLQQFEALVASIRYQPNPNRMVDGGFPTGVPVSGGVGNPANGLLIYQTFPVLAGNTTCADCHALPVGTSGEIDDPNLVLAPQSTKQAQLRGLWEKTGWNVNNQNNNKGFGFNSDSEFAGLLPLLQAGFNFGQPTLAPQRRRDVEAFLLAFDTETHAAIGQQVAFDGSNNGNAADIARLNVFLALADAGTVAVVAKATQGGESRGYVYATQGLLLSDREHLSVSADALRLAAAADSEVVFTVVPSFSQYRSGVDRDADGYFDRDELDGGGDPANASSWPSGFCKADFNVDGTLDASDLNAFSNDYNAASPRANYDHSLGGNGLPSVDAADLAAYQGDYQAGCGDVLFQNGFE